jgi:hypothetical protein
VLHTEWELVTTCYPGIEHRENNPYRHIECKGNNEFLVVPQKLKVFENRLLRRIFELKRDEAAASVV